MSAIPMPELMKITDAYEQIAASIKTIANNQQDLTPDPPYSGHNWTFLRQETREEARFPHGAITATFDVFHCSGCPQCQETITYRLIRTREAKGSNRSYDDRPIFELPTPPSSR